jgi:3-oxoacyl-[acyl-carrier protein] reductase
MTGATAMGSDLTGRSAIVTGAARGIGLGIARELRRAGASVVLADLDELALTQVVSELSATAGPPVRGAALDVRDPAAGGRVGELCADAFGTVDILVNNVGIYPTMSFDEVTPERFDEVVSVNLRGTYFLTQGVTRWLREAPHGGVIVNVASVAAVRPSLGSTVYGCTKAALVALTQSLAVELAPANIRVVCVSPGPIVTEGVERMVADDALTDDRWAGRLPAGRRGTPADIGAAVAYLAGPAAGFVTGVNLLVDGGLLTTSSG